MASKSIKRLFNSTDFSIRLFKKDEKSYTKLLYNIRNRCQSQWSNPEDEHERKNLDKFEMNKPINFKNNNAHISKYGSAEEDDLRDSEKWKPELAWLTKALEPALQLYKWALPSGTGIGDKPPPTNRSLAEIYASIQRSNLGLQHWSLSDLTVGLYLIYLRQASMSPLEDVTGDLVSSESIVQDLIYHTELAKGAYRDNAAGLARNSMLRESNVVKFIKNSSVLRPGYYIGIDMRRKLVILGIRGTHTVYDLITDIISSSHEEITSDGYSTHFGTAEAARWFLTHEIQTIRQCLEKHKGFRLRLVGHSLGGATASLLAIMLRQRSKKELGFDPDIISAVGYATSPCVCKELAESCSDFVTTVVMQDDIIPRLNVASLTRLRNEILQTDWVSVFEKEDWKHVIDLISNARQVVSSVQDVTRKLSDYAKRRWENKNLEMPLNNEVPMVPSATRFSGSTSMSTDMVKQEEATSEAIDLVIPGTVYYLKRNVESTRHGQTNDFFTLFRRKSGEHFQRILLSSNIISDHKCDSHYYALRDVLKGLPGSSD